MPTDFQRIAIVNRGEPAMRFIKGLRDFNRENGTELRSIVLYTTPDRRARFVAEADEAVDLGAAAFNDPRDGRRREAYLDYERVRAALEVSRADAVWVGWGFVSERPDFAELCEKIGLVFIGPDSASMRRLGNKITAKQLGGEIGVPVIPWGGGPAQDVRTALGHAQRLGFPVVIKSATGEGGRGIRRVESETDFSLAFESARYESQRAFGDATVYVEKWVPGARHIEVQILADNHGTTWALGVRDCSIQRRHQKIMEEAPPASFGPELDRSVRQAAVALGKAAKYRGAGTVEFLLDPATGQFGLMEVNARLQVEHPVTELTTGVDLVELQLRVARGERLEGEPPATSGHAIEVRLNAEDAENGFAAAPGRIEVFSIPPRTGIRLDSGVAAGDEIPAEYDSMIAKLIAWGRTRGEALDRLVRALEDSAIVISGGTTNRTFLLGLLGREEIGCGAVDSAWLDRQVAAGVHVSTHHADVALIQAAIDVYEAEFALEREQFFASAARMRPVVRTEAGRSVELRYKGQHYRLRVYRQSIQNYLLDTDQGRIEVEVSASGQFERWLTVGGRRYRVLSSARALAHLIEVEGTSHKISRDDSGVICAYAPSVVVSVDVAPGDRVSAGQRIALLEAMKMEIPVSAPVTGVVREVMVLNNAQVGTGAPLVRLESEDGEDASSRGERVLFKTSKDTGVSVAAEDPAARMRSVLNQLEHVVLGCDIHPGDTRRLVEQYNRLWPELPADLEELNRAEDEILRVFVDVSSLFRRQAPEQDPEESERLSTGEYLYTYLRTMESRGSGLPPRFISKLQRALKHYGSDSLEPTPALRGRLLWIFKSHQNIEQKAAAVTAILERRLGQAEILTPRARQDLVPVLTQLVLVCENRFPALADLARDVRYRFYDQPAFERSRDAVYTEMEEHLSALLTDPGTPGRSRRIQQLVDCHYPMKDLLSGSFATASAPARELMLEVLTRRYYRLHQLEEFRTRVVGGRSYAIACYNDDGKQIHLITTHTEGNEFDATLAGLKEVAAAIPQNEEVVADLYTWHANLPPQDEMEAQLQQALARMGEGHRIERLVFAIAGPGAGRGMDSTLHFTFHLGESGYVEERLYRGLHPMMSERLQLWRLQNFYIERLNSADDIFLFRAVARENPKDQRLIAIGEVRDFTAVRDAAGRLEHLPHLERIHLEALAAIRQEQLRRAPEDRLHWNRVFLYVWPPIDLKQEEIQAMARQVARQTEGLGMEKVVVQGRMRVPETGEYREMVVSVSNPAGRGIVVHVTPPSTEPLRPLTEYVQKVVRMRQRGLAYPYEIVRTLAPSGGSPASELPPGDFIEYDIDKDGKFGPVDRPAGLNRANVVVGLIRNRSVKYPEGMTRAILLGDPSREVGSIAEPECRRILAAIDLAESMKIPLEWFTLSAGAKISMESGTENMDWISRVLRRLIDFTQAGGEVNIVVTGINVGAQPYWNAEATMLMHTRGILIMMPESAMVLTGKTALDYSGSVSAEDNQGIGGYEHIMGPNGQAQYWASDITEACQILMRHYDHTYIVPGEPFPRRSATNDPATRDVCLFPHRGPDGDGFALVGDIFSDETNPGRKKPFDIRKVMLSVTDQDHTPLERWTAMQDAEIAVIWDAHVGGYPVCLLGFESRSVPRVGFVATDGPEQWTSGTLFPEASKKVARAINAASNNRPLVILANLSGFDGSPESMRRRQLEFGAEIGRGIVNFRGPIIFCVISRYHGGAFVVFSRALNENMEVVALEGTYASVIGGAPAAAVVFAREVDTRTRKDPRVQALEKQIASADESAKRRLRAEVSALTKVVRSEKLGEVAEEFDSIHSVHRALKVGSLDRIIPASTLRPYLIDAVARGIQRCRGKASATSANS
jgi:acetyl/propionyl-CoA carboxylase alpha subunit/acetyl-CoA carboxylase carboxyltransferase component